MRPNAQPLIEKTTYRAWAEVDLGAVRHNIQALQKHFGPHTKIMAVVKANAYGLGAVPVARAALEAGASALAVSSCEEGVALREAGLQGQMLVMGYVPPDCAELAAESGLTLTVNEISLARALSQAARRLRWRNNPLPVQLKLDTGLHRYGLEPEKALELAQVISSLPGLSLQGLYTHFATGDDPDPGFVYEQMRRFDHTRRLLERHGFNFPQEHLANSASAINLPRSRRGMVRIGLSMLGYYPSEQSRQHGPELEPCLTLKSVVARLSRLEPGEGVGYNLTYIADEPRDLALVPFGYADGYRRALSNKGEVLIGGQRARVLGRIMMDQFVVDVTGRDDIVQDDEVVLIGRQGEAEVTLEEVATVCDTIPWEILTGLGPRVQRVYTDNGVVLFDEE
jgi:alanine racemase